jgi:3-hydroxyisobutyrate dehydrogenase
MVVVIPPAGKLAKTLQQSKEHDMAKVRVPGLGVSGSLMAGHLVTKGGHEVTVYNAPPQNRKSGPRSSVAGLRQPPKLRLKGKIS